MAKGCDYANEKGKDSKRRMEPSKWRCSTNIFTGLGPTRNRDNKEVNKKTFINNLCLQIVLGRRLFAMDIIDKPGMDSLHVLVEIQSWIHLFQNKSHVLHAEEIREFYYSIEFVEYGRINSRASNKSLICMSTYWDRSSKL